MSTGELLSSDRVYISLSGWSGYPIPCDQRHKTAMWIACRANLTADFKCVYISNYDVTQIV
jgi:hypothetical protein